MESWAFDSNADLRRMQGLTTRLWSPTSWWQAGSLAWEVIGIRHQHRDWPVRLWGDPDRISAWAFVSLPNREMIRSADETVTLSEYSLVAQVDPDVPGLAHEVVAWFEQVGSDGELTAAVADGQEHLIHALTARGLVEDTSAPFALDMRCSLGDLPAPLPPEGYAVRSVTPADLEQRVEVHRRAWAPSKFSPEMYADLVDAHCYDQRLDIVAVAPDGEFAASCLIWLDPEIGVGELEPVGTDPNHRGVGAGPAACLAAMHALRELGGSEACVRPRGDDYYPLPRRVYGRLGFETVNRTRAYRRSRSG